MNLFKVRITHELAAHIAPLLVDTSQWFAIEPLPDDVYDLSVKAENQLLVAGLLKGQL